MSSVILALESATEACSAALWHDGVVYQRLEVAPRRHAELLLPQCEAVLAEAGLARTAVDAVAFGRGPGAFTGLRIAAGIAQGLSMGLDRPVVPVSSLAALAASAGRARGVDRVLAALDARMGEVYWGGYQHDGDAWIRTIEEVVLSPEAVTVPTASKWFGAGSGWEAHGETLRARMARGRAELGEVEADRYPEAAAVAELAMAILAAGGGTVAAEAAPVYLRPWRPGS
ncbi:MAG: tRNA (adenosine(37)-N6)-threonylcarbamoyltransferase complex dimerization subunit type 1 TsaB [Pseudomonadota bacterium]